VGYVDAKLKLYHMTYVVWLLHANDPNNPLPLVSPFKPFL